MTLIDALPRDDDGQITLPVGGVTALGKEIPGVTTETFVRSAFSDFAEREVPLSDTDYQELVAASTPNWRRNWERWRAEGRI